MKYGSITAFLESTRVLIENSRDIPAVAQAVAGYGYDSARIGEGVAALTAAQTLVTKQIQEYGEAYQATEAMNLAWEAANQAYTRALKVARVAFANDTGAIGALKLSGPRKDTLNGWLEQATPFYDNLLVSPGLKAAFARFGYPETRLKEEQKLLSGVRQAINAQLKESGEAQTATHERDRAIDALDTWASAFKAICKVALADNPQNLEQLGITVLNQPRKKPAVAAAKAKTPA